MEEKQSMTMAERARMKLELTINQPMSFQQIKELEKVKRQVRTLWREENKTIWLSLEKCRMYSQLVGKEKEWNEWWEENKFGINIKSMKTFYTSLKLRECQFCGNPFRKGRADKLYCSTTCATYACRQGLTKKSKVT